MTTLEIILTFVTSLITLFLGGQSVLYYRQTKRLKSLENAEKEQEIETKVIDGWQEYVAELKAEKAELKTEISKLETDYNELREKHFKALEEKEQVKIENVKLTLLKCEVPSCPSRKPPTGY